MAALEPKADRAYLSAEESTWKFHGGPNDGLTLNFFPQQNQTRLIMGRDRYAVRHHDRVLLYSPVAIPKPKRRRGDLSISAKKLRFLAQSARTLDLICSESEPLIEGQMMTVPTDLIERAKKLFAPTP